MYFSLAGLSTDIWFLQCLFETTKAICSCCASLLKPFQHKLSYLAKSRWENTSNSYHHLETTGHRFSSYSLKWLKIDPAFTKIWPIHMERESKSITLFSVFQIPRHTLYQRNQPLLLFSTCISKILSICIYGIGPVALNKMTILLTRGLQSMEKASG